MTRQERRAAARKAAKELRKATRQEPAAPAPQTLPSEARLQANRLNARASTGPKTAETKAISSQNSFKHGLYSKQVLVKGEDPAELDALKADLLREHQPATETESILVNEMAEHYWRMRRARAFEARLLEADEFSIAHMNAALRLLSSAERGFYKALKTLRELQKARGFVPQPATKPEEPATGSETSAGFVPPIATSGFVPQTEPREIERALSAA